jgi:hypothetical protein
MGGGKRNRRHKAQSSAQVPHSISQSARSQQTDANIDDISDRLSNLHVTASDNRIIPLSSENWPTYSHPVPSSKNKNKSGSRGHRLGLMIQTGDTPESSADAAACSSPKNRKTLSSEVQSMPNHIVHENVPSSLPVPNRISVGVRQLSTQVYIQGADTQPLHEKQSTAFSAPQLPHPEPTCDILFHSMSTTGSASRVVSTSANSLEANELQRPTSPTLQAAQRLRRKSVQVGKAHGREKDGEDMQDITAETLGRDGNHTKLHTQISWAEESTLTKKEAMDAMAHFGVEDKQEESSNADAKGAAHKYNSYTPNLTHPAQSDVYLPPQTTQQPIHSNKPVTDGLVEIPVSPVSSEPVDNERSTSFSSWEFESKEDVSQSFEVLPQPSRFATALNGSERRWYRLWRH